jgi:hypothetical protein
VIFIRRSLLMDALPGLVAVVAPDTREGIAIAYGERGQRLPGQSS